MAAYNTFQASKGWFRKPIFLLCRSKQNIKLDNFDKHIYKESNITTLRLKYTSTLSKSINKHHVQRLHSQTQPPTNRGLVASIMSYFSGSQREARERKTDGIPLPEPGKRNYIHNVYTFGNLSGTKEKRLFSPFTFNALQTANLLGLVGVVGTCGKALIGNFKWDIFNGLIRSEEYAILDQIGLGLVFVVSSLMYTGFSFFLYRVPIRIYYDEFNGIYTAAFCRFFLPFKTATLSFPAESMEVLPENRILDMIGLYKGPTLKIHPVQRDVYIHHLQSLVSENKSESNKEKNDKDYFPPAAASANLAVKAGESVLQLREAQENYKQNKSTKKVSYMPPAYASAVAAVAADKAATGKGLSSWAAKEKICLVPMMFFVTPVFYHKMIKNNELE